MKKLNWLDKFAQEMAQKEQQKMKKQASSKKKTREVIVSPKDVPNARNGKVVAYKGKKYRVVQANYRDSKGPGVVLAAYEGMENDPMAMAMGTSPSTLQTNSSQGQEYAYTKLDIEQTYDFDQDVNWGTESAQATMDQINYENSIDRTTVENHYKSYSGMGASSATMGEDDLDGQGDDVELDEDLDLDNDEGFNDEDVVDDEGFGVDSEDDLDGQGDDVELDEEDEISLKADEDFDMQTFTDVPSETVEDEEDEEDEEVVEDKSLKTESRINSSIVNYTKKLAQAIVDEQEESLAYAESVIKRTVPGRYVKPVLASLEKALDKEGLEVSFDKTISKQQIKNTASERATNSELVEVRDFINNAIVTDTEAILEEADSMINEEVYRIAKSTKSYGLKKLAAIEEKMKSVMERKMKSMGIHARLERKYKVSKKR